MTDTCHEAISKRQHPGTSYRRLMEVFDMATYGMVDSSKAHPLVVYTLEVSL
jgi:hypothetical protein